MGRVGLADLVNQLAALQRERQHLEGLLKGNRYWESLTALDAQIAASGENALDASVGLRRETVLAALSDDRIFQAYRRIDEAIVLLRDLHSIPAVVPSCESPGEVGGADEASAPTVPPRSELVPSINLPAPSEVAEDADTQIHPTSDVAASSALQSLQDDHSAGIDFGVSEPASADPTPESGLEDEFTGHDELDEELGVADSIVRQDLRTVLNQHIGPVLTIKTAPPEVRQSTTKSDTQLDVPDDLTAIRGITSAQATQLLGLGVARFEQISNWTTADVRTIRAALGLGVAISQQNWIEQAAVLAARKAAQVSEQEIIAESTDASAAACEATDEIEAGVAALSEATTPAETIDLLLELVVSAGVEDRTSNAAGDRQDEEVPEVAPDPDVIAKPMPEMAEGLMAIKGMSPVYVRQLSKLGIRTLSQLSRLTTAQFGALETYLDVRQQLARSSWIEQATVLARGKTTRYLEDQRRGEFVNLAQPSRLQPTQDKEFAARLTELINAPVLIEPASNTEVIAAAEPVAVEPTRDALQHLHTRTVLTETDVAPHLRLVETTRIEEPNSEDKSTDGDSDISKPSSIFGDGGLRPETVETVDEADAESAREETIAGGADGAQQEDASAKGDFTVDELRLTANAPDVGIAPGHDKDLAGARPAHVPLPLLADAMRQMNDLPITRQAPLVPPPPLPGKIMARSLAEDVASDPADMPGTGINEPEAFASPGNGANWHQTADSQSIFEDPTLRAPDFREFVEDSLGHTGPVEANVEIVRLDVDEPAFFQAETDGLEGDDLIEPPRFAPVFMQPDFVAEAVDDLPGTPLPGDPDRAQHAAYRGDVQEASVEIVRTGDNTPHRDEPPEVVPQAVSGEEAGALAPKPKTPLSRFFRALTGE